MINPQDYVGLTEAEAIDLAKLREYKYRISSRDGAHFVGTRDVQMCRINLTVKDNVVTSAHFG